ncbi:hypothetical protein PMAYCL1PPCAC_25039, partial [Pristionchus mayeri]
CWGFSDYITWEELTSTGQDYVIDGTFIIDLRLKLEDLVGLRKVDRPDFFEANDPLHGVTLIINGDKIYASKQILALHSQVFHKMFFGQFKEKYSSEVELQDINKE